MKEPCGKQPILHLEPCCREAGHSDVCWPWAQLQSPSGIWLIEVVNANDDGTAGPIALKAYANRALTLQELHEVVANKPGYPESGLSDATQRFP